MDQQTYNAEVDARAQQILDAAHAEGRDHGLWAAHALMLHGPSEEDIVDIIRGGLWRQAECPARRV